ncbi:MAG: hypothetical protein RBT33_00775 [Candidatus Dojkabacteria bacterium]|jgi:hypothetical protein|nr:hypothetical protein [Candidatus Dojkabacteria bacterium]
MSRLSELLTGIRTTLGDLRAQKFDESTLLSLIDEGQKDIAMRTRAYKGDIVLDLFATEHIIELPEDVDIVLRASIDEIELPLISYDELDAKHQKESKYGPPRFIIYDKLIPRQLRLFPNTNEDALNTVYGVVTDIDNTELIPTVGEICTIVGSEPLTHIEGVFGVVTAISVNKLRIQYSKIPPTITSVEDSSKLVFSHIFDQTLKFYASGKAFRIGRDTANRAAATEELMMYERDLAAIMKKANTNSASTRNQYTVHYNGGLT